MQIIFEKTWEDTLSDQQKQAFIQQFKTKEPINDVFAASPILLKRKRNGGLVATVFLQNNSSTKLSIREITPCVLNDQQDIVAKANFSVSLDIDPYTATPWSFVFSPEHILSTEEPTISWQVSVE
ncbi:SLAP domain-containing protein [Sporosarcina obsidiansis]|uniref:SLAP domain-containing protein n=1 Tax=Sporosarcina obsidiansis TaxID=2660748 RepID=UPI00129A64E1|nr:SLAP domain-containing protein [Sporosarcina obsidiansis]